MGKSRGSILLWPLFLIFGLLITIVPNNIEKKVFNDVIVVQNIVLWSVFICSAHIKSILIDLMIYPLMVETLTHSTGSRNDFSSTIIVFGYVGFSIVSL